MVNKDNIRMFFTQFGMMIGEEVEGSNVGIDYVKLMHPFRLIPQQDGKISVAALFMKEEWCTLGRQAALEVDVPDALKQLYIDYESQVHGSIVMPQGTGKIIL